MANYEHKSQNFYYEGIDLVHDIDTLPPNKYVIARNIRSYQQGVIQPRSGITAINTSAVADLNVNSIKRLNDDTSGASQTFAIIIAAGSSIYSDNSAHTAFTSRASGFSTSPKSIIPFRPNKSPRPYAYIADGLKMGKLNVDGTFSNLGIASPTTQPSYSFTSPTRTTIDTFTSSASWTATGSLDNATKLATTTTFATISAILYDTGSTGWCSVGMTANYIGVVEGNRVVFDPLGANFETCFIEKVLPGISNTTIKTITYDSGTTGNCTIVLNKNSRRRVQTDALIQIDSEVIRVVSTAIGSDDQQSFRCSTTSNHTSGATVTGLDSFRTVTTLTHVAAESLATPVIQVSCTGTPGVGSFTKTGLTLDLSNISGRSVQNTDEMFFAVRVLGASEVSEVQILLDCGDGTFTQDFYIKSIKPSDFQSAADQTQTTEQARINAIQSDTINNAEITPQETPEQVRARLFRKLLKAQQNNKIRKIKRLEDRLKELAQEDPVDTPVGGGFTSQIGQGGSDQFWILRFRVDELFRVGSNSSVGLKNINALRVNTFITTSGGVGDPSFQLSAWWIGGTFGPDVGIVGTPYTYRYRYLSSTTGTRSYPSPALRATVQARRQRVQLSAIASSDSQVDKVEWFRFGGSLNIWKYIGTGPNATTTFNDDFPDDSILNNEQLTFEDFQPFPIVSTPITGTVSVSGTMVTITSGAIPTSLAAGTQVIIDGMPATLYATPISTTKFETVENLGGLTSVSLYIPEPVLVGQPLPCMWGPFGQGFSGQVMFACGDATNSGTLYWTNPDDPDSASDRNQLEVTSPSEPLMNGFLFNNNGWVFSSEDLYIIYPAADSDGRLTFKSNKTGLGLGLGGRWSYCVGEGRVWLVSKDGIYVTEGNSPVSITDQDLYPLFPHDGLAGSTTYGVIAPDFSSPDNLRLSIGDSTLRFDYKGIDTNFYTLLYDINNKAWYYDSYGRQIITSYYDEGKTTHRWLMGSNIGKVFIYSGTSDDSLAIACQLRTKAEDFGDFRLRKVLGDFFFDLDPASTNITITPTINNHNTALTAYVINNASRIEPPITEDVNSGAGVLFRNIDLDISWSSSSATPKLYGWDTYYLLKVDNTFRRFTDYTDIGYSGPKLIRGIRLRADTENIARAIRIQYDNVLTGVDLTVQHNGELWKSYDVPTPFMAYLLRIAPQDSSLWRLYDADFIYDKYPDLDNIITSWTDAGVLGDKWLQGIILKADTNNLPVEVIVRSDDGNIITTLTCTHLTEQVKPYSWTPYITHEFRLEPQGNIRIIDAQWVFSPEPELTNFWVSQPTGHGIKNYQHLKDCYLGIRSNSNLTFRITIDNTNYDYTIASTGGAFKRIYLPLQAVKGKVFSYSLTPVSGSTGFRVYEKDFSVRVKEWGSSGEYLTLNPLGLRNEAPIANI